MPTPFQLMPIGDAIPPVYHWLAEQPGDEVVFELPVPYPWPSIGYIEGPRLYYATVHRKQLLNGYSGFFPPVYQQVVALSQNFPNAELISWLKGMRVNILILHHDQYSAEAWSKLVVAMTRYQDAFDSLGWYGDAWVLRVRLPEWKIASTTARPVFGAHIRLLGYEVIGAAIAGKTIAVRLYWQAVGVPEDDVTVFVHLLNSDRQLAAQHDGPPQNGSRLTSTWHDGEVIVDEHKILLPTDLLPGEYQLQVGLYHPETIERLPIYAGAATSLGDALQLSPLSITR